MGFFENITDIDKEYALKLSQAFVETIKKVVAPQDASYNRIELVAIIDNYNFDRGDLLYTLKVGDTSYIINNAYIINDNGEYEDLYTSMSNLTPQEIRKYIYQRPISIAVTLATFYADGIYTFTKSFNENWFNEKMSDKYPQILNFVKHRKNVEYYCNYNKCGSSRYGSGNKIMTKLTV